MLKIRPPLVITREEAEVLVDTLDRVLAEIAPSGVAAPGSRIVPAMGLVLGVEGDGAHTHAVLTDSSGTLLGFGVNDDSSDWDSVGIAAAAAALRSCITEALHSAQADGDAVGSAVFGLAGVDFPVDERRLGGIPEAIGLEGQVPDHERLVRRVASRARTSRSASSSSRGTGPSWRGGTRKAIEYRSLGLGRLYGDFGSETDISESALTAVAEAFIGLGPPTSLTTMLCEFAGVAVRRRSGGRDGARPDRHHAVHAGGDRAPPPMETWSRAACSPTRGPCSERPPCHVIRTLRMEHTVVRPRARAASVRQRRTRRRPWRRACFPIAPGVRVNRLAVPPVIGAALLAVELAGAHAFERRAFETGRRAGTGARHPVTE